MTDALVEFVHEFSALDSGGSTSGNNSLGRAGEMNELAVLWIRNPVLFLTPGPGMEKIRIGDPG